MCVRRCLDSERYHLLCAVRGDRVVPLTKKSTLERRSFKHAGPFFGTHYRMTFMTLALHLVSLELDLKTLIYRAADHI